MICELFHNDVHYRTLEMLKTSRSGIYKIHQVQFENNCTVTFQRTTTSMKFFFKVNNPKKMCGIPRDDRC